MTTIFRLFAIICILLAVPEAGRAEQKMTVFAAASLKEALDEVISEFSAPVVVSYAGSGMQARQVEHGAPADVIILANAAWMDWLDARGMIDTESRRNLLGNALVLVGPKGAAPLPQVDAAALLRRLNGGRLAIGQTQGVPAGIYGREWLENTGLWAAMQPHLAQTDNVRAALALVSRGEAALGLVYASDARADPGVGVVYEIEPALHSGIRYPAALVAQGASPQAKALLDFLGSEAAMRVFRRHGFQTAGAGS